MLALFSLWNQSHQNCKDAWGKRYLYAKTSWGTKKRYSQDCMPQWCAIILYPPRQSGWSFVYSSGRKNLWDLYNNLFIDMFRLWKMYLILYLLAILTEKCRKTTKTKSLKFRFSCKIFQHFQNLKIINLRFSFSWHHKFKIWLFNYG